jgi:HAMP domain-containing protein
VEFGLDLLGVYRLVTATPTPPFAGVSFAQVLLIGLAVVAGLFFLIQLVAYVMGFALARSITGAVHELFEGTEQVRQGDFSHKINVPSQDQLGELASSFNTMTSSIEDLLRQKAQKDRLEQELEIARGIQMSLLPQAPLEIPQARKARAEVPQGRLAQCLALIRGAPLEGLKAADAWLAEAKGSARSEPGECKGLALTALGRWQEAAEVFAIAHDDTPLSELPLRARRGAMAGNAALAAGETEAALAAFDSAHAEARRAKDAALSGGIALDRARALVTLERTEEAAAALAEARAVVPDSALSWLLSATLSRRKGKLTEAQAQIERAAALAPADPEIGLEAGVIAVLGRRDEAARRSWRSVIAMAPESTAAKTARGYLDQLGPEPQSEGR